MPSSNDIESSPGESAPFSSQNDNKSSLGSRLTGPQAQIIVAIIALVGVLIGTYFEFVYEPNSTPTPTPTASNTPTFTSTHTPLAINTPLPTLSPTPSTPIAIPLFRNQDIRSGPDPTFMRVNILHANDNLPILGISEDRLWYLVLLRDGRRGWILANENEVQLVGDHRVLREVSLTPTFTPSHIVTVTYTPTPTLTSTLTSMPTTASPTPMYTQTPAPTRTAISFDFAITIPAPETVNIGSLSVYGAQVTNAMFTGFTLQTTRLLGEYGPIEDDLPRTSVNWHDADNYCRSLGWRLPTEAELRTILSQLNPQERLLEWTATIQGERYLILEWDGTTMETPAISTSFVIPEGDFRNSEVGFRCVRDS